MIDGAAIARRAAEVLLDKKGQDIKLLDVRGLSSVTDYYLIASGSSVPHLKALFGEVVQVLKHEGMPCYRKVGDPESGWMAIDYFDVMVHIFSKQAREYYAIEELWAEAPVQDIEDPASPPPESPAS